MLNQKVKLYLIPAMVVLFILGASFVYVVPKVQNIQELINKNNQNKLQLTALTKKAAELEGLDFNSLKSRNDWLISVVPTENDVPYFWASLRGLIKNNDLSLNNVTLGSVDVSSSSATLTKTTSGLTPLEMEVEVKGKTGAVKNLLTMIPQSLPLASARNLEVEVLDASWETVSKVNFHFEYYTISLPQTLGSIEKPIVAINKAEEDIFNKIKTFTVNSISESDLPMIPSGKTNPFRP